jgi:hypothetical protein
MEGDIVTAPAHELSEAAVVEGALDHDCPDCGAKAKVRCRILSCVHRGPGYPVNTKVDVRCKPCAGRVMLAWREALRRNGDGVIAATKPRPVPSRETAGEEPVDPRIAKHGGTRKDRKSNYDFAGMMDSASWRRTEVHEHTRWYGCALCGQKFSGPHAVYGHLAKRHDR